MSGGGGRGGSRNKNRSKNKNKSQKQGRVSPPVNDIVANGGSSSGKDDEVSMSGEDDRIASLHSIDKLLAEQITIKQDRVSPPVNNIVAISGPSSGKDDEVSMLGKGDRLASLQSLNKILTEQITIVRQEKGTLEEKLAQMESKVNHMLSLREENGTLAEKLIQKQAEINSLQALRTNFQSEMDKLQAERVQLKEQLEESRRETGQLKEQSEVYEREMKSSLAVHNNLEATVLQLKDQIQVTSAELGTVRKAWGLEKDDLLSQLVAARKEADEVTKASQTTEQIWNADKEDFLSSLHRSEKSIEKLHRQIEEDQHLWNSEKTNLKGTVAELQTKLDLIDNESGLLRQKNTQISTEAHSLKVQLNESGSKLKDSNERCQELSRKIKEERHLWDAEKSNLEGAVAELKIKFDLMASEKLSASRKNGDLSTEVESLKSLLNESKGMIQESHVKIEEGRNLWDAEKRNLEDTVAELIAKLDLMASDRASLSQKNGELSTEAESLKVQLNKLESELIHSKGRTQELCRKSKEDWYLWDAEKDNLKGTVAELQTKLDLIDNDRELLRQKNTELSSEVQSLKVQLNEDVSKLNDSNERYQELCIKIREERHLWNAEKDNLEGIVAELKIKSDLMASEKLSVSQKNGELSSEVESLNSLLNGFKGTIQELRVKIEEGCNLWDAEKRNLEGTVAELKAKLDLMATERASLSQKNGELSTEAESLKLQLNELESELIHSKGRTQELCKKIKEDRHMWDAEKDNLEGTVAELQTKLDLVDSEKELLSQKNTELSTKLQSLKTDLVAAKSAYDEATVHLNKIKEEKEALDEKLMLQRSKNNELEEELLSTKFSFEEIRESVSKGEQQIANLQSQLLAVAEEKDGQIFDIQSQLSAMAEEKRNKLADLQDQLSSLAEAKMLLEEKNAELERGKLVLEEEQLCLKDKTRELEASIGSLNEDLEASRAMAEEKEGQLSGLQYQLSNLAEEKRCLEEKNNSLLTDLNKYTLVSEEKVHLQDRIKELETYLDSLNKDLESRDIMLKECKSECQNSQSPEGLENGKPKCVHANGEPNGVLKQKPKSTIEKKKPKSYYAWPAVASTGALAAAAVTAYLKFSK